MSEVSQSDVGPPKPEGETPLVPKESIGGRALMTVVAIMTFLAALAAGAAILIAQASVDWRTQVAREATVQIKPAAGRDMEADLRAALKLLTEEKGFSEVRPLSKSDSEKLLEPWLGGGIQLDELPVPRLIMLKLNDAPRPDLGRIRAELAKNTPNAVLDDHHLWSDRLAAMANSLVALAMLIFVLLALAMALAVSFATRSAMEGNRDIIEVLHVVGASDRFISRQFERRFSVLGLKGALVGAGVAALVFFLAHIWSRKAVATPSAEQLESLFGSFSIGWTGYVAILAICIFSAAVSGQTSRWVVYRRLRSFD